MFYKTIITVAALMVSSTMAAEAEAGAKKAFGEKCFENKENSGCVEGHRCGRFVTAEE